jgi:hypothetical protein
VDDYQSGSAARYGYRFTDLCRACQREAIGIAKRLDEDARTNRSKRIADAKKVPKIIAGEAQKAGIATIPVWLPGCSRFSGPDSAGWRLGIAYTEEAEFSSSDIPLFVTTSGELEGLNYQYKRRNYHFALGKNDSFWLWFQVQESVIRANLGLSGSSTAGRNRGANSG